MGSEQFVLLVESDENVIRDVLYSLNLVALPVKVARSVLEAKKTIVVDAPLIIVSRLQISTEKKAAVRLARELADDPEFSRIPLVLLSTAADEQSLAPEERSLFQELFRLPVKFPVFSQYLEEILSRQSTKITENESARLLHDRASDGRKTDKDALVRELKERIFVVIEERLPHTPVERIEQLFCEVVTEVCSGQGPLRRGDGR